MNSRLFITPLRKAINEPGNPARLLNRVAIEEYLYRLSFTMDKVVVSVLIRCIFILALCVWCFLRGASYGVPSEAIYQSAPIAFVQVWQRSYGLLKRAAEETGTRIRLYEISDILTSPSPAMLLSRHRIIIMQDQTPEEAHRMLRVYTDAKRLNPRLLILALHWRNTQKGLERSGLLKRDSRLLQYWAYHGLENLKRMLLYLRGKYLGEVVKIPPPVPVPEFGIYHPDATRLFKNYERFANWYAEIGKLQRGAPMVALMHHKSFWVTGDTATIDALCRAFERHGINFVCIIGDLVPEVAKVLLKCKPSLIMTLKHGEMRLQKHRVNDKPFFEALNVPLLQPIELVRETEDEWRDDVKGLHGVDFAKVLVGEVTGAIHPIVVGAVKKHISGMHGPIPERVERFVERAMALIRLQAIPNHDKRVAIIYYNRYLGQGDVARGSSSGAFLNTPRSLMKLLRAMKRVGYTISPLPSDEVELLNWMKSKGRIIPPWAGDELERLVAVGKPVLISEGKYRRWFKDAVPIELRHKVIENFGEPPGKLMVIERGGEKYIVIPKVDLGNVVLLPQPERGEKQDERLLHSRTIPPPHNYIAFYLWLQREFKPHAIIHFGTHGSLELLPGKRMALSGKCFPDMLIGYMVHIYPWIVDNVGEATLAKRRTYATLVTHLPPPFEKATFTPQLRNLHDDINKFMDLEPGLLRERYRAGITKAVKELHLDDELALNIGDGLTDEQIQRVLEHVHTIYNNRVPMGMHVLGELPARERIVELIASVLGAQFMRAIEPFVELPKGAMRTRGEREKLLRIKCEQLLRMVLFEGIGWRDALRSIGVKPSGTSGMRAISQSDAIGQLRRVQELLKRATDVHARLQLIGDEINNILRALDGRYVPPGGGGDIVRNPNALPTGRNMYALNPDEIPTKPSWQIGSMLADELLEAYRNEHGHYPQKVAFDLSGMETLRDFGVLESMILRTIGVEPVWDDNNIVVDVRLIPLEQLQRPRVDVFVAMGGWYKENFPSRVKLLAKAFRIASQVDEPLERNYVRKNALKMRRELLSAGMNTECAEQFSYARIFGKPDTSPGGTKILYLIPRSHLWDSDAEIASVYIANMNCTFTESVWGEDVSNLYRLAIQGAELIARSWSSHLTTPLTNHHIYEHTGGLSLAIKHLTGNEVDTYIADVRDVNATRLRTLKEVLYTEMHAQLFNPKWLKRLMEHGYAGASQMAELVKNIFGWQVTRPKTIRNFVWDEIAAVYVRDKYRLGLPKWFDKHNPYALQEIAAALLEASRKGYWRAPYDLLREIAEAFQKSVRKHGRTHGLFGGSNVKLDEYIRTLLEIQLP